MFIVDDVLFRVLGVSIPAFDLLWVLERVNDHAYSEKYNPTKISDKMKENRLLYELGERSAREYGKMQRQLQEELAIANEVLERIKGEVTGDYKLL